MGRERDDDEAQRRDPEEQQHVSVDAVQLEGQAESGRGREAQREPRRCSRAARVSIERTGWYNTPVPIAIRTGLAAAKGSRRSAATEGSGVPVALSHTPVTAA